MTFSVLIGVLVVAVTIWQLGIFKQISHGGEGEDVMSLEDKWHSASIERSGGKEYNHLITEKSPYLLQHADNPVAWYPWGDEAFEKARREDKPIFLSIGYSTCHWCHVMEHESFEDADVARRMNEVFVSIKVDREERPDIDHLYMTICQAMTGRGGWPLTVVMTPDKKPFFAGTYFPKESRPGIVGMLDLITALERVWKKERDKVSRQAKNLLKIFEDYSEPTPKEELGKEYLKKAYDTLLADFDHTFGGFGQAPKFPQPSYLLFLLRYWKRSGEPEALNMVEKTLQSMRQGGLYDHIGFGFHRYSTDTQWLVPHFEKMLYDQALLAMAYTEAYQATGRSIYLETVREIFNYTIREMKDPAGGFYSAEDADSEGVEGKFYLWSKNEIYQLFPEEEAAIICRLFGIKKEGNFFDPAHELVSEGERTVAGANILHFKKPLSEIAGELKLAEPELEKIVEKARQHLFSVRSERIHPFKDDKILTDWNGLMIAALAQAARVLDAPEYLNSAKGAANFILTHMLDESGRLLHRYRQGNAAIPAMVDDYVFFIWGLIELYETSFDTIYLRNAISLTEQLLKHFWDDAAGGLYLSPDYGKDQIIRTKAIQDGALPSGNSVAALNFLRLSRITGNPELEKKAVEIGRTFSALVQQAPSAFCQLLVYLDYSAGPAYEIIIIGDYQERDTQEMLKAINKIYLPNKAVIHIPAEEKRQEIVNLAPYTQNHQRLQGKATAYICHNYICQEPTTDIENMLKMLK